MQKALRSRGFTLIELLTVIAIIAVLAAILFPLAGTIREQARANDCMSKLHQLYVSANVYRSDEGAFPPALFGLAEVSDGAGGSTGIPMTNASQVPANADRLINGFLYAEQIKDANTFRCPDNANPGKARVTIAHYRTTPPPLWPAGKFWIGQALANYGCPTDGFGVIDCFIGGPYDKMPKFYYVWDSYDIGPAVTENSLPILLAGQPVYEKHYSADWTGSSADPTIRGLLDLPNQLKYTNPPDDKTLLAYCTWHARIAKTNTVPCISNAGTAKKLDLKQMLEYGANIYNR
jgi:prepilin-type N-terminal cleavage/methylation domain-containing protein